jgi:hypothetical protein
MLRLFLQFLPLLAIGDVLLVELVILPHAATWLRVLVHALGATSLLWLVFVYVSFRARPHELVAGQLTIHRGLFRRLTVPISEIASVAELPSFSDDWKARAYRKGALRFDVPGPTVLELRLRDERRVLVSFDDPASFVSAVQ